MYEVSHHFEQEESAEGSSLICIIFMFVLSDSSVT